jgi:hypothetical protein
MPDQEPEALPLTQWKGKKVAVALMAYRNINADVHFALYANYASYGPDKIGLIRAPKATEIHRARSQVANVFMRGDAEYLIMVDDDMLIPYGNEGAYERHVLDLCGEGVPAGLGRVHGISKLMSHGPEVGIVGGLYTARGKGRNPMVFGGNFTRDQAKNGTLTGLHEVDWIATGFIRIHRSVFKKIKDAAPTKFKDIMPRGQPNGPGDYYGYFLPRLNHQGEDSAFCSRAKEVGVKCYLDSDIKCGHVGEYVYMPGQ